MRLGAYNYHMPRYYSDKIFKNEYSKNPLDPLCKAKVMAASPLSRALADRAQLLRSFNDYEARKANLSDSHSGFKATALSQDVTFVRRNTEAKQSLLRFYQRSHF